MLAIDLIRRRLNQTFTPLESAPRTPLQIRSAVNRIVHSVLVAEERHEQTTRQVWRNEIPLPPEDMQHNLHQYIAANMAPALNAAGPKRLVLVVDPEENQQSWYKFNKTHELSKFIRIHKREKTFNLEDVQYIIGHPCSRHPSFHKFMRFDDTYESVLLELGLPPETPFLAIWIFPHKGCGSTVAHYAIDMGLFRDRNARRMRLRLDLEPDDVQIVNARAMIRSGAEPLEAGPLYPLVPDDDEDDGREGGHQLQEEHQQDMQAQHQPARQPPAQPPVMMEVVVALPQEEEGQESQEQPRAIQDTE